MDDQLFLGVDPGISGAWAIINRNAQIVLYGSYAERAMLSAYPKVNFAVIEKVGAMPGQGVVSMFTFGEANGIMLGWLEALHIPYGYVTPQKWQKEILDFLPTRIMKTGVEDHKASVDRRAANRKLMKGAIVNYVIRHYPETSDVLKLKKNEGRADAICLALYARKLALLLRQG